MLHQKQNSFKNARLKPELAPKNKYDIIVFRIMSSYMDAKNKERAAFEAHWN